MVLQNHCTLIKFRHIFSFHPHLCNCVNFHAWSDIVVSILLLSFTNLTHWYAAEWQRNAVSAETLTRHFYSNFNYFFRICGAERKRPGSGCLRWCDIWKQTVNRRDKDAAKVCGLRCRESLKGITDCRVFLASAVRVC